MSETKEQKINHAITKVTKEAVFPNTTNHYDTLFGGTALQWMDEVAFYYSHSLFKTKKMVTVSSDKIDFNKAISCWNHSRINWSD